MNKKWIAVVFLLSCVIILGTSLSVAAQGSSEELSAVLLISGLEGGSGSTIGPDGALYVAESAAGIISRIDLDTGEKTVFATGLPKKLIHTGGIMDIAFIDATAYALVTLVGEAVGGDDISGIYRIDDTDSFTIIADIGKFSVDNPPDTDFFVPTGLQYAMETFQGGFLVTDGHHNRVLKVTLDGDITQLIAFDNIVPTGLEVSASTNTIYMTEAGPVPHLPENGKVMAFELESPKAREIASGARLLVDVEYGCCGTLYALAQGNFKEGSPDGSPAQPNTGSLVKVNADSTFTVLVGSLNQPTSLEIIGDTAYVITLNGEIWKIDDLSGGV
jgi:sugar lactone lactonase YvrE